MNDCKIVIFQVYYLLIYNLPVKYQVVKIKWTFQEALDQSAEDLAILRELETNSDDENRDPAENEPVVATEELLYSGEGQKVKEAPPNDIEMCLDMERGHQHSSIHG